MPQRRRRQRQQEGANLVKRPRRADADAADAAEASKAFQTGKRDKLEAVANDPQENPITAFTGPVGPPKTQLVSKSKAHKIYNVDVVQLGLHAEADVMEAMFGKAKSRRST